MRLFRYLNKEVDPNSILEQGTLTHSGWKKKGARGRMRAPREEEGGGVGSVKL